MALVQAKNLTLDFPIYGSGATRSFKKTFLNTLTGGSVAKDSKDRIVVRALDDLTFKFSEGDRVGIVGHNGAGKSTLLRTIAGVYEPTSGSIETRGKIMSMLSITLGIDLEASGFENIYLRGRVMGYSKDEIDQVYDDIVEFSGVGDYLGLPLRTYSSGMLMRLAFAVSTSMSADIILMDEWLSVGDAEFTQKADERIRSFITKSKILFLASHDERLIKSICNKIIVLEHGRITSLYDNKLTRGFAEI